MDKREVLDALEEIGLLLELKGENPFKTRAYANAARKLDQEPRGLAELVETGELGEIPGIGKALREKITTLVKTGGLPYLDDLRASIPVGLPEVLRVPGLGPKKVRKLWVELGIESLADLEYACNENRLVSLDGFGVKSQAKALDGIRFLQSNAGRRRLPGALAAAEALVARVRALEGVARAEVAGSVRRRSPVVKDLDLVVAAEDREGLVPRLVGLPGVRDVTMRGAARTSLVLDDGLAVDFRIVPPRAFASALVHFTGSKEHNVALRRRAKERGFKLSEYGLTPEGGGDPVCPGTEEELYARLDLAWVPPERREDLGEVEAAAAGPLPRLVEAGDVRGLMHAHTTRSDGAHDLATMARRTRELGYDYLVITDHSQTAVYASGLGVEEVRAQRREIDEVAAEVEGLEILHGIESDILADGSLDYPDEVLAEFDLVIGSIHAQMTMPEDRMTARVLAALDNPYLDVLGHPTGRILLGRRPFALDMDAVLERAGENGVIVEINANPARLDLDYALLPRARAAGVRLAVNPDAHSTEGLEDLRWGIDTARKGGLGADAIVNTLSADELRATLRRTRTTGGSA